MLIPTKKRCHHWDGCFSRVSRLRTTKRWAEKVKGVDSYLGVAADAGGDGEIGKGQSCQMLSGTHSLPFLTHLFSKFSLPDFRRYDAPHRSPA